MSHKRCITCEEHKEVVQFKYFKSSMKYSKVCLYCIEKRKSRKHMKRSITYTIQYRLWNSSRNNAKRFNRLHTIQPHDIPLPTVCVYLGIELSYDMMNRRDTDNKATIDRIDSSRGYTPDNIQVISHLANRMKTNATPQQMLDFAIGVLRVHGVK